MPYTHIAAICLYKGFMLAFFVNVGILYEAKTKI